MFGPAPRLYEAYLGVAVMAALGIWTLWSRGGLLQRPWQQGALLLAGAGLIFWFLRRNQ